jgi:hypothetical protein
MKNDVLRCAGICAAFTLIQRQTSNQSMQCALLNVRGCGEYFKQLR